MKYRIKRTYTQKKSEKQLPKPFTALARNEEIDLFGSFEEADEKRRRKARLKAFFQRVFPKRKMRPPIKASLLLRILFAVGAFALLSALSVGYLVFGAYLGRYDTVTVPDLIGMSADEAAATIPDSFEYTLNYEYNPECAEGSVISQSPKPSVKRKLYSRREKLPLKLTVNASRPTITLPYPIGMTKRDALLMLRNAGIEPTLIEEWSDMPIGQITYCSYSEGEPLSAGQRVILKVSRGKQIPLVSVPALCGLSEAEATARLEKIGLLAGKIKYQHSDQPLGRVIAQQFSGGSQIEAGTSVALTVSIGKGFDTENQT